VSSAGPKLMSLLMSFLLYVQLVLNSRMHMLYVRAT